MSNQEIIDEIKGRMGCIRCGERNPDCIDFHHVFPGQKRYQISSRVSHSSMKTLLKEMGKCVLLCSNCHRTLHKKSWKIDDLRGELAAKYGITLYDMSAN